MTQQNQDSPQDNKPLEAVVHVMVGFQCPNLECGEQLEGEENLELNPENKHRAEVPAGETECSFCGTKVFNRKYVVKGF